MNALILVGALVLAQVQQPPSEADEANALVQRIQENLAKIDETLLSTFDTDDPAGTIEAVRQTHMDVIRDLEELIKQAKYQPSSSGGGGGGSESQPPPQQQPESESEPRESDGSSAPEPGEQDATETPQGHEGEQEQQQQQSEGEEPRGDQLDDSDPARNNMGGPPPEEELSDPIREDTDARWGLLPPKLQERLMNLHVDDVPARYHDWLSAYIRAMQRLEEAEDG
jgi:hypothetical protein